MPIKNYCIVVFCICFMQNVSAQETVKPPFNYLLIDTHNDILTQSVEKGLAIDSDLKGKSHSDLSRWKQGGLNAQVFSVWCDGNKQWPFIYANRQIDTLYAVAARNPDKIVIVHNAQQLQRAVSKHQIAAMFGVEGGHMIENKLDNLDSLYKRGTRYMTLTWNNSTSWASSAKDETEKKDSLPHKGLTDFGKQVVERMNRLGMLVDLSHVGEQTFWDAINTTTKPVLVSHSCVYSLCPVFRNLKDDQIKAVAKNGGVISVNFYSGFLDSNFLKRKEHFVLQHKAERDSIIATGKTVPFADDYLFEKYAAEVKGLRATLSCLIDHIDYIVKMAGIDHVGLGSDFDGIESPPQQLDDVTTYPLIVNALLQKGYSKKDIRKIMGKNFIRVLKANEVH